MRILKVVAAILLVLGLSYGALHLVVGYTLEPVFASLRGDDRTLLSDIDLSDGNYRLLIYDGSEPDADTDERIARMIDDHALIERHRNEIDIKFALTEYLPGEGRGDYYIFLYRGEDVVAGRSVPSAIQIVARRALLERGKAMRYRRASYPLEEFQRVLSQIGAREDIIIRDFTAPSTTDPNFQHTFHMHFPTIAVLEDSGFDGTAYARGLAERIRDDIGDVPFRASDAGSRLQSTMILDENERAILDDDGLAISLSGIELHEPYLVIQGSAATYQAVIALDLDSYVADRGGTHLIENAWMSAMNATSPPATIMLADYTAQAGSGPLLEAQYEIRYWEPAGPPSQD